MKKSARKDFTYRQYFNSARQDQELWGVYVGRNIRYSTCRSEEDAALMCKNLNDDPWYYERDHQFMEARNG